MIHVHRRGPNRQTATGNFYRQGVLVDADDCTPSSCARCWYCWGDAGCTPPSSSCPTAINRAGCQYGKGCNKVASIMVNTALVAPMPNASIPTASNKTPADAG
jgi:hypothetical protein